MELIANDKAPKIIQSEEGATYDKMWKKKSVAQVNLFLTLCYYTKQFILLYSILLIELLLVYMTLLQPYRPC